MVALMVLFIMVVLALASAVLGSDSRDGNDWGWHPRP
jgi:hypothetical protein